MTPDLMHKARCHPTQLVENRVSIAGRNAQLSIYDTYEPASRVPLSSEHLLYCGMITGRKVMHSKSIDDCEFLPYESFVIAPGAPVYIDFPDARPDRPTTCLAIEIARDQISRVTERLHDEPSNAGPDTLAEARQPTPGCAMPMLHVAHSAQTQALLERVLALFQDDDPDRDTLIDLALEELIVRMMRTRTRELLLGEHRPEGERRHHGLSSVVDWIAENLASPLDGDRLARMACMSRAQLYRQFRREFGSTPCQYQQTLRMEWACRQLRHSALSITQICHDLGFRSSSHFCRSFKAFVGMTPSDYRGGRAARPESTGPARRILGVADIDN
ncbi:helix-turn-helix domain-containing protein [uncultured Salinisphaera sp.]|uniref:helix-turn-helix domain-containing protein n=1 Tax=uncultured Salinisphaera sp. TaxID=359372 RepID=UPI0032B1D4D8|tara:strand:+ start:8424 stop:9416 length:993 start_codon:yes stop_codon:yes gene_type:complete